jgi:hypothetical protein
MPHGGRKISWSDKKYVDASDADNVVQVFPRHNIFDQNNQ